MSPDRGAVLAGKVCEHLLYARSYLLGLLKWLDEYGAVAPNAPQQRLRDWAIQALAECDQMVTRSHLRPLPELIYHVGQAKAQEGDHD